MAQNITTNYTEAKQSKAKQQKNEITQTNEQPKTQIKDGLR